MQRNETVRERVAPALYRREDVAETLTGTSSGSRCSRFFGSLQRGISPEK